MKNKIVGIFIMTLLISIGFISAIATNNDDSKIIEYGNKNKHDSLLSNIQSQADYIFSSKGGQTHLCQGGLAMEADSGNGNSDAWEISDAEQLKQPPCNSDWIWEDSTANPSYSPVSFCEYINITCSSIEKAEILYTADDWIKVWINNVLIIDEGGLAATDHYWKEIHIMDITNNLFGNGIPNELKVTIEDKYGDYAGGIWCIKVWCCDNMTVGECDNFDDPYEPTNPSQNLLDWIYSNYVQGNPGANSGSRYCDEYGQNQYWAHTFDLTGICTCNMWYATLFITVENLDDNDHLKVGCITDTSSVWEHNVRIINHGIPVNTIGTITLPLNSNILDCMCTNGFLDVAVDDDSAVDCAILLICCGDCECILEVEIQGGLHIGGGIPVDIRNVGAYDCYDIDWEITSTSLFGSASCSSSSVILSLPVSSSDQVICNPIGFFGIVEITAEAKVCNQIYSDTAKALIVGPIKFVF